MEKEKYYVVLVGRRPGIYASWEDAKLEVEGYSGNQHRAFRTEKEASAYWESHYGNSIAQPGARRTTYDEYGGGEGGGYEVSAGGGGGYGVSGGGGYGGGEGGACYNCGKSGHMARDCYQGGGGGRWSSGGGGSGGGRGCYNCGEQGHFARECPYEQN